MWAYQLAVFNMTFFCSDIVYTAIDVIEFPLPCYYYYLFYLQDIEI